MSQFKININDSFSVLKKRFNNQALIEKRVESVPATDQGSLRTTLKYLYLEDGPINLPRATLKKSISYLEDCEAVVVKWLITRTNGSLRKTYGKKSLLAARKAHYKCEKCGYPDVRALHLDHVEGKRNNKSTFACLCANCHNIKSRKYDWDGKSSK